MTRRGRTLLCALVLAEALGTTAARSQFGFFYGPPQQRRVYRPRRQVERPKAPAPQAPRAAEVPPLPPPRPRFPGDPPAPSDTVEKTPADAGPTRPDTAKPVGSPGAPPASDIPPAPPIKPDAPASRAKPDVPSTPAVPAKPAAPVPAPTAEPSKPVLGPNPPPLPPAKPPELAKPAAPGVAPSGAKLGESPRQPADDATCSSRLAARKVVVEPTTIGPQPDSRCTVVQPVRLMALTRSDGGKIDFPEHPTIACTTADTFSTFVGDLLSPLAKGTLGAPVSAVWTGPGLECRSMDHIFGAKLSAHGQGLAIDIARLKLADGRVIEVGQAKGEADQAFEMAARNAACGYFHTVLGPGTDSYHRTHWHFDLIVRGAQGDTKYCR